MSSHSYLHQTSNFLRLNRMKHRQCTYVVGLNERTKGVYAMHNNVLYRCRSHLHLPAQQIFAPIDMQQ